MTSRAIIARRLLVIATAASVLTVVLLAIRLRVGGDPELAYMFINLGLAWIPLALALAVERTPRGRCAGRFLVVPVAAAWILFLPNAPYLVTDLVHVDGGSRGELVLDSLVLGVLATTGLLLFVASVVRVEVAVTRCCGRRVASAVVPVSAWLAGVGIYLGRVLRWNSWDAVTDPAGRVAGLAAHLASPGALAVAVAVVATMGACLALADRMCRRAVVPRGRS